MGRGGETGDACDSVPARPISEGAAPCPYWLVPCPIYTRPARIKTKNNNKVPNSKKKKKKKKFFLFLQNVIAFCVFRQYVFKNACKMLADLCPCFHQLPTRPNFGRSQVKVCPILCRLRTKLC